MGDAHPSSAAAFVEGGVQDACEESCSICLEPFCDNNPATVTSCIHEYHLQCILEWAQRSKECPMCWQPLCLKDPNSQELLEAVERERSYRQSRPFSTVFERTPLEDLEFHRVPAYADDSDFEERIMQHLAAAAMGRAHHFARRESLRSRPSNMQGHPQFVVVPTHPNMSPAPLVIGSVHSGGNSPAIAAVGPVAPAQGGLHDQLPQPVYPVVQSGSASGHSSRSSSNFVQAGEINRTGTYSLRQRVGLEPVQEIQQRTGPSEFQSFSESFKSRLVAASSRYRESFVKTTRGFRERLRSRNGAMTDFGARTQEAATLSEPGDEPQTTLMSFLTANNNGASTHSNVVGASNRVAPQPLNNETSRALEGIISKDIEGSSGDGANSDHNFEESSSAGEEVHHAIISTA